MVARFASIFFAIAATLAATGASAQTPARDASAPLALPEPIQAKDGLAVLPDTRLYYWDTGGDGPPIVLVHPATGSAVIWGYQAPALAKAGYRVIGYSRRSYYNSDPLVADRPGIASEDLDHLADYLGLKKFHLVGSAAGGGIAADYAVSHPDRLLSLVIASNPAAFPAAPSPRFTRSCGPRNSRACRRISASSGRPIAPPIRPAQSSGSSSSTRRSPAGRSASRPRTRSPKRRSTACRCRRC
jgi:pimeloyl-ACP methyl ester carboxylesterase